MDAIRRDHDVGGGAGAIGEGEGGFVGTLLEADALVAGVDYGRGKLIDKEGKQIGPVEAVELDLRRQLGRPHGSGKTAVGAAELGIDPAGGVAGDAVAETQSFQHAHAVGLDGDAGADLGQRRGLFVELHIEAAAEQRKRGGDAADAAADDGDAEGVGAHAALLDIRTLVLFGRRRTRRAGRICR